MARISDYVIGLSNFYGFVDEQFIIEIYNMHHEQKITELGKINPQLLKKYSIERVDQVFVSTQLLSPEHIEAAFKEKQSKPYFIPTKSQVLGYKYLGYHDVTPQFINLYRYVEKNIYHGKDPELAHDFTYAIQQIALASPPMQVFFDELHRHFNFEFESEAQMHEFVPLLIELINNTRLWINNGYTPSELAKMYIDKETSAPIRSTKLGRNETCHCGSGKKYKHCCLNKDKYLS